MNDHGHFDESDHKRAPTVSAHSAVNISFYSMLGSLNLTTVNVKGVAAALDKHTPKGESKGIKAYFRMDENGILNLEKVCVRCMFFILLLTL